MTLTKNKDKSHEKKTINVGEALCSTLVRAASHNRLTVGVVKCAQVLSRRPDNILLCILPKSLTDDAGVVIHQTLIEAYCREYDYKLLKVESHQKISQLLPEVLTTSPEEQEVNSSDTDLGCLVITQPDVMTTEEDFVIAYHDTVVYCDIVPCPSIEIPG